jgi:hypothetical protein
MSQQGGNSSSAERRRSPRKRPLLVRDGAGGRPDIGSQASLGLLPFSLKQRGRWKGQGGDMGRGLPWGAASSVGQSSPIEETLPPSGLLLNRILL